MRLETKSEGEPRLLELNPGFRLEVGDRILEINFNLLRMREDLKQAGVRFGIDSHYMDAYSQSLTIFCASGSSKLKAVAPMAMDVALASRPEKSICQLLVYYSDLEQCLNVIARTSTPSIREYWFPKEEPARLLPDEALETNTQLLLNMYWRHERLHALQKVFLDPREIRALDKEFNKNIYLARLRSYLLSLILVTLPVLSDSLKDGNIKLGNIVMGSIFYLVLRGYFDQKAYIIAHNTSELELQAIKEQFEGTTLPNLFEVKVVGRVQNQWPY